MSNAAKNRKRAVEFEQLKQFDKAISAYIRAIEDAEIDGEDVDVALYNKVGDLTLRMGRVPDAVTYYERAVDRYASVGLFNNAIALCNKILRNAPGRSAVYFTLGRICAKKGLRGDASRNFLEYAARMRTENRTDEAMRALAEVAEMMPELTEVRGMVEEHAARAGIVLKRRDTPTRAASIAADRAHDLVFLDVGVALPEEQRPATATATSLATEVAPPPVPRPPKPERATPKVASSSIDEVLIFDPTVIESLAPIESDDDADITQSSGISTGSAIEDAKTSVDYIGSLDIASTIPDLVTSGEFHDPGFGPVEGLTGIEPEAEEDYSAPTEPLEALTSRMQVVTAVQTSGIVGNSDYLTPPSTEAIQESRVEESVGGLEQLEQPNAELVMEQIFDLNDAPVIGVMDVVEPPVVEPLVVEPVPEIDQAIAEGAATAAAAFEPMRLDPHDFILPGELPPLLIPDSLLRPRVVANDVEVPAIAAAAEVADLAPALSPTPNDVMAIATPESLTPVVPLAVAEAVAAATARHTLLAAAVQESPTDWPLRHRFAEALVEVGEREEGIAELERVLTGFLGTGDQHAAFEIADQLVQIGGHRIKHHQKRVELAVRLGDSQRLRVSYLDLADALVRIGEDARAHAVYARVLELDPRDERARAALGAAAPPLPGPQQDESYVDLASWLRDDDGTSTRMRMHEPTITGDEQADFDALLRHFKEGVARSIGDDDHDSHYDLGVAYKEMGLLDDAVAEFQKALTSRVHRLPAYEALGQCFVEQGRHQVASTVLSRALHEPGLGDEQRIGVLYLLGYSLEALQRTDDARGYFQRVYATDKNFRDVAARLAALDQVAQ